MINKVTDQFNAYSVATQYLTHTFIYSSSLPLPGSSMKFEDSISQLTTVTVSLLYCKHTFYCFEDFIITQCLVFSLNMLFKSLTLSCFLWSAYTAVCISRLGVVPSSTLY